MKIKAKIKDCHLIVKAKLSFGEKINEKELDSFARLYIRGFLKPRLVKKNTIEYTGPVGISLLERFHKPITKRDFFFMMEQIVIMSQKLGGNALSQDHVILNMQSVFINENTKELQFVYLPLEKPLPGVNVLEFIETIICSVKLADEEDMDYASRFSFFIKNLKAFDSEMIERYISKEDRSVVNTIKKQNVGQSGFMTDKQHHYYEHYKHDEGYEDCEKTGLLVEAETDILQDKGEETGLLINEVGTYMDDFDSETGLLADTEETGLLCETEDTHFPTLFRILTEETIKINKQVFRLGKERSYVDYFVNNNAVSRSHADIITRGSRYYVNDLNSKNHTYINGQQIAVKCETEIHDGDCLKLGNEEFIFYE